VPSPLQVQQVAQLVERPIEIVEYQQHSSRCVDCGQVHTAPWQDCIVPGLDLGVRQASPKESGWATTVICPTSKLQELLRELGDIDIGVGTLQATNARMAMAVEGSVELLREWAQQQPQVHVDESPWPVLGLKEWIWVIAGQAFCESLRERVLSPATLVLFHAGDTRSRAERSCSVRRSV